MGQYNRPIPVKCWEQFLASQDCRFLRIKASHHHWKCPDCFRTITFRGHKKNIPRMHIDTNLKTMKIDKHFFNKWIDENC